MNLLVLVGSNRAGSFTRRLADLAVANVPADVTVSEFDLDTLPFYSEDRDAAGELGQSVADFRAAVAAADAIVVASPAYNGAMSAQLKNAIDTASRPRGEASIAGKPVAVLAAVYTPGADQRVIDQLNLSLKIAGAHPLEQAFGVTEHFQAFDESGLVDKEHERELHELIASLFSPVAA